MFCVSIVMPFDCFSTFVVTSSFSVDVFADSILMNSFHVRYILMLALAERGVSSIFNLVFVLIGRSN